MKKNCTGGGLVLKIVLIGGTNTTRIIRLKEISWAPKIQRFFDFLPQGGL